MADEKSKIPDVNEIASMAGKLFKDVKKSISEIIKDYKANRPADASSANSEKSTTKAAAKAEPASDKDTACSVDKDKTEEKKKSDDAKE